MSIAVGLGGVSDSDSGSMRRQAHLIGRTTTVNREGFGRELDMVEIVCLDYVSVKERRMYISLETS
jgi:hypothetical protein